jgi:hypothetical protein
MKCMYPMKGVNMAVAQEIAVPVGFAPSELANIVTAAAQCKLSLTEYIRLATLGITLGPGAVNRREAQRSLASPGRTRR